MNYESRRYAFFTLDPVHVGAGGYRLGRVDMTIVREPGTNLPKIPGTTLLGAARSYAAMQFGKPEAAGQHRKYLESGAARDTCPILYTFGTSTDAAQTTRSFAGTVSVSDARVLLFPVYSQRGPLWVGAPEILREAGFDLTGGSPDDSGAVATTLAGTTGKLNVGWLLMELNPRSAVVTPPAGFPSDGVFKDLAGRILLVSLKYFPQIVNSNTEVRTSVVIDPTTGAAEAHGLFTYEAIPRATLLWSEVVEDDYSRQFPKPAGTGYPTWTRPLDVLESGFKLMEPLGVGGMGTRGFGRLRLLGSWKGL